jgi:hypothetical protein
MREVRASKLFSKSIIAALSLAAIVVVSVPVSLAQEQQEFDRRRGLFEKFTEIGQKAEQRKDYLLAVGMYEAALERSIRTAEQEPKYVDTLTSIIRCYINLSYYWRVEPVLKKLLPVFEQNPRLYSSKTEEALMAYSALLRKSGRQNDALTNDQLVGVLSEKRSQTK